MADYKFKRGDRVRTICKNVHGKDKGQTGTTAEDNRIPYVDWDDGTRTIAGWGRLELIEPKYKTLSPKVGDRFRVVKDLRFNRFPEGETIEYMYHDKSGDSQPHRFKSVNCLGGDYIQTVELTTEYLEPVEEDVVSNTIGTSAAISTETIQRDIDEAQEAMKRSMEWQAKPMYVGMDIGKIEPGMIFHTSISGELKPIKQETLKQKAMNIYRKARMSKDEKTLHEAGFMTNCGEPTEAGKYALTFILWEANKKALVEMAQEAIDEQDTK